MSKYIGITIGPIYDTIMSVSSPAGLWGASYFYSYIARSICEGLLKKGINQEQFISPYFDLKSGSQNEIDKRIAGVGLFHDRIIFQSPNNFKMELDEVINTVKKQLTANICDDLKKDDLKKIESFINDYIQIYYVIIDEKDAKKNGKNCIQNISSYLDAIELNKTFPEDQTVNYLLKLFEGQNEEARNEAIKNSFLMKDAGNTQLLDTNGEIKSIERIAGENENNKGLKKYHYFAIVQADGDNIGHVLNQLSTDADVRTFSKKCLEYTSGCAKVIKEFGGVTIYAGGDDLLFLAPVENNGSEFCESKGGTIFSLNREIAKIFTTTFKSEIEGLTKFKDAGEDVKIPSVSFGVSIHYCKYPLYEALAEATELLFNVAKQTVEKNCMALKLSKASGQTLGLIIKNADNSTEEEKIDKVKGMTGIKVETISKFEEMLDTFIINSSQEINDPDEVLHSVIYKTLLFDGLFKVALKNKAIDTQPIFDNIYDSSVHKKNRIFINEIKEFFDIIRADVNEKKVEIISDENNLNRSHEVVTLEYLLRLAKFFTEKEGER